MTTSPSQAPDAVSFHETVYRQCPTKYGPFFQLLKGAPTQPDRRWNCQGENLAQYWSYSPWGAFAELIRFNEIRSRSLASEWTRDIWAATPSCTALADLSTFDKYDDCGLDPAIAVDDDHTRAQSLRRWLETEGFDGVISPSAALPGESNVTMFGERLLVRTTGRTFRPGATPLPHTFVAASQVAIDAAPPLDLILDTRYRGQPHQDLERWRRS